MGKSAVLIFSLFLIEEEFGMVALCRGTAKLLFTILIIFFLPVHVCGVHGSCFGPSLMHC